MQSYELASLQSYGLAMGFMGLVAGFLLGRWCGGRLRIIVSPDDETDSEKDFDCVQSSSEEPLIYVSRKKPSVYHDDDACHYVTKKYRKLRICKVCEKLKKKAD